VNILNLILSILWSLVVSWFAVPAIIDIARSKNLMDAPNHRTSHKLLTPRLGGVAIFAGFVSSITIFGHLENGIQQLLAGSIIIFFLGVRDDLGSISKYKKLIVQLLAGIIIVFIADIRITSFYGFLGIYDLDQITSSLFTLFVIIGITNALNLIDGIDGLAGVVVITITSTFGFLLYKANYIYSLVAFSITGSVIGFLRYNLHKAKVFMGDTGSLVCGFVISILAIEFIESNVVQSSPAVAIAILILPIFDTLRVFIIRIVNGGNPLEADKNHIHHRLLDFGLKPLQVVALLFLTNLFFITTVLTLALIGTNLLISIIAGLFVLISFLLEIITKKKLNEQKAF